jgi:hypothetical protein
MNAIALQEPGSNLKGRVTACALPGKAFIWLPFAGGISAFAVILYKRSRPTRDGYNFQGSLCVSNGSLRAHASARL